MMDTESEQQYDRVHSRLTELGIQGDGKTQTWLRIHPYLDRLTLLPVGEPDTADLVGEINERCDRAGAPEGTPAERVEWLAGRLKKTREGLDRGELHITQLHAENAALSARVAELEAELGQLDAKPAKKPKPKCKVRKSGGVTLRMTPDEASTLRQIVACIGGHTARSARKYSNAIRDALETAGVTTAGHRLESSKDELRFKDFA